MASNFQYQPGTNGYLATPFNLMSTELNTLGSATIATSSVGGTAGVFNQTQTVNAIWGDISLNLGGSISPVVGGSLLGWFLRYDGAAYERTIAGQQLPRAPDFVIPLYTSETSSAPVHAQGLVLLSAIQFKVLIYNNSGVALPASGTTIKLAPFGVMGT